MNIKNIQIINYLYTLWSYINYRKRKRIYLLLFLMLVSGLSEMITIAAVIPFLLLVTEPEKIAGNEISSLIISFLRLRETSHIAIFFSIIFCIAILSSVSLRLLNLWFNARISGQIGNDFSYQIFNKILNRKYENHISDNSSQSINTLT